jgi:hypothetical protein
VGFRKLLIGNGISTVVPVDFGQYLRQSVSELRDGTTRGLIKPFYYAYVSAALTIANRLRFGKNIYDENWNLLIILDACRVDALSQVTDEYSFLDDPTPVWSCGSTSEEWLCMTFNRAVESEVSETSYITANPYISRVFHDKITPPADHAIPFGPTDYDVVNYHDFDYLDSVVEYGVDESVNAVPPRVVTDRAIDVGRQRDSDRMIAHYMQPHTPFLTSECREISGFEKFLRGDVSKGKMWDCYLDNLRHVLDEVELLLENVDASNVVITADHGEMFGEWGFYMHPIACPHPHVRKVPWITTSASDENTHQPADYDRDNIEFNLENHLGDLGYL